MRGEEIAYMNDYEDLPVFVNVDRYPDGSPMVKHERESAPHRVLLRPRDSAGFLGGIFWVQSLIEQGERPPELVIPCVFGQRQDRINPTGDTLFTIKSVGNLINSLGCPRVTILDPHSEATPAVIDRVNVVHVDDIFRHHIRTYGDGPYPLPTYDVVVAPDVGAEKRAARIAKLLKLPLKQAKKSRNVATGKITGFEIEDCDDLWEGHGDSHVPRALVVDDLCDAGGTFLGLGQVLDEVGFDSDLYVTHGLFTRGTQDLQVWYQRLYCTDSVAAQRPGIHLMNPAEFILEHGDL